MSAGSLGIVHREGCVECVGSIVLPFSAPHARMAGAVPRRYGDTRVRDATVGTAWPSIQERRRADGLDEWRQGAHDDLVLVVALAIWWGASMPTGSTPGGWRDLWDLDDPVVESTRRYQADLQAPAPVTPAAMDAAIVPRVDVVAGSSTAERLAGPGDLPVSWRRCCGGHIDTGQGPLL